MSLKKSVIKKIINEEISRAAPKIITESELRKIIKEELIEEFLGSLFKKKDTKKAPPTKSKELGSFFSDVGNKLGKAPKVDRSMSGKEVGETLGVIDNQVEKLAKNAEKEDMPKVASKIRDEGDDFLDTVKDSGMIATGAFSKEGMFDKKKKFDPKKLKQKK